MHSTVLNDSLLDVNTRGIPFLCNCPVSDGGRGCYCGHRTQGYIAQWLERLTADQQVPGSIPGGDRGSILIGIFSGTAL